MNYINYFDNKVKEKLDQNAIYQLAKNSNMKLNNEIENMRNVYPLVFRKNMSFENLVDESRSFEQSYDERDDEIDEYDYKISRNFFDKTEAGKLAEAKANAIKYFEELGRFIKDYPTDKLAKMSKDLTSQNKEMRHCVDNTVKKVIVEQISSPELTSFINDFFNDALPTNLGEYGNKIKDVISEEYVAMKNEDNMLRRQIQNEIQRLDNEKDLNDLN